MGSFEDLGHRRPDRLLTAGCYRPDTGGTGGTGGEGGSTGDDPLTGTDAQVCGAACSKLTVCGAELDQAGCKSDCVSNATFINCFRQVESSCDFLAACVWGVVCGTGGIPNGSASCGEGQSCLISCSGNPSTSCGCACAGAVAQGSAMELYALAVCASVHCNYECSATTGDPSLLKLHGPRVQRRRQRLQLTA
ncbi:MAG: hypothetical protein R3F14_28050 [Polyangiaceae bacterium]